MDNPSIISHVSLGTNNFAKASAFYEQLLATIGARRIMEHEDAAAFGKAFPEFWIVAPMDRGAANAGNGTHMGFFASSRQQVDRFYETALKLGATGDGEPGPREEYGAEYYGCFVRDLDGHKIEATFWDG